MKSAIKVDGGFTIETLQNYAKQQGGNIKGRMAKGMLEVYSSKKGAGLFPMRSMRKQGLANAALHTALANSFGEKVANAVVADMGSKLYAVDSYLTHDLIAEAERKARIVAARQASTPQEPPINANRGSGKDSGPEPSVSDGSHNYASAYVPPPLLGDTDSEFSFRQFERVDGRNRAVSDASGGSSLFDSGDDVSDVSDIFDDTAPDVADDGVPVNPKSAPQLEQTNVPAQEMKQTLSDLAAISDSSRTDRLQRLEAQNRSQVNLMAGRRFLAQNNFGALLMSARDPDVEDRLGKDHGFSKESTQPGFQGPSHAGAEQAILKAFERYDNGSAAALNDSEKWDLAVDALEDYLALRSEAQD